MVKMYNALDAKVSINASMHEYDKAPCWRHSTKYVTAIFSFHHQTNNTLPIKYQLCEITKFAKYY